MISNITERVGWYTTWEAQGVPPYCQAFSQKPRWWPFLDRTSPFYFNFMHSISFKSLSSFYMLDLGNTVEPLIDAVDQACQQDRQEVEAHVRLPFHP